MVCICRFERYLLEENATLRWSTLHAAALHFFFLPPPTRVLPHVAFHAPQTPPP